MRENIILSVDFEGADLTTKKSLTLSKTIHELGVEKKRLAKEIRGLDQNSKTYEKDLTALIGRQNQVNAQLKVSKKDYADNERAVINATKANRALDGSLEQQQLKLRVLQQEWKKVQGTSKENTAEGQALKSSLDSLTDSVTAGEEGMSVYGRSVGNYGKAVSGLTPLMGQFGAQVAMVQGTLNQIKTALAGTATAQKGVTVATTGTNKALKLFRIALISTGIGAIVLALGSLIAAVASTQRGMDKMNRITTYVGEIFGTLFGILQDVGVPAWKALKSVFTIYLNTFQMGYLQIVKGITELRIAWNEWTGDADKAEELRGELDETKKKIKEVVDETKQATKDIANAGKEAMDIIGETNKRLSEADARAEQISNLKEEIALLEISQKKQEAILQLEIESQRKIRKNKSLSDTERRKAEKAEIEATQQLRQLEIDLIDKKREKAVLESKANDTNNEAKKEIADLEAEAIQKQAQLQKDLTRITQEGNRERKAEQKERLKAIEEERAKEVSTKQEAIDKEIKLMQLARKMEIAQNEETAEEKYQNEVDLQEKIFALKLEKARLANEDTLIMEKEHILSLEELKRDEIERIKQIEEQAREEERKRQEKQDQEDLKAEERRQQERKMVIIESAKVIADEVMNNRRRRLEQENKREIDALNLRRQAGEISEEEFAKKREEIDRKAFQKKKDLDSAQAVINGFVGASKIIAQTGILSPAPLIALGVQTAAQVAGIRAQSFADGGYTGLSSAQPDHTGERPVGVVHEREFVANRRALATPMGSQLASQLNQINKNPSLGYFADGGFTSSSQEISTDGIERVIQKSLGDMRVINVATDTSNVDKRVKKIQNKGKI